MKEIFFASLIAISPLAADSQRDLVPMVEVTELDPSMAALRSRLDERVGGHPCTLDIFDRFMTALQERDLAGEERICQAILYAAEQHQGQRRLGEDASPYICHPIGVALILLVEGAVTDPLVLTAAVLHDTLSDTGATLDDLREHFGEEVASIVAELTQDKNLPQLERKRLQVLEAPHKSHAAKLVKLGDKIHNLRSLEHLPPTDWERNRIDAYWVWSEQVVQGMRGTSQQLEGLLDALFEAHQLEFSWG